MMKEKKTRTDIDKNTENSSGKSSSEEESSKFTREMYETVIKTTLDGFWVTDTQGHFLAVNDAYCRLVGYGCDELLKKKVQDLEATETSEETAQHVQKVIQQGYDRFETKHRCKDGKIIEVDVSVNFLNYAGGRLFVFLRDMTEQKKMEQELFDSLEESKRHESEISALLKASKAVLQHREFQISARSIFDSCKELIGASAGYVALLSKDGKENEVLFLDAGGLPCTVNPYLSMPIRGLRAETYNTGKVAYHNDFLQSEWAKLMPEGHVILKNVLFAPLIIDKKTVGIIGLANKPGGFNDRDAHMALAFGEIASVALINGRMLEMLENNEKRLKAYSEHLEELVKEETKKLKDAERLAAIGETAGMVGHDIRNPLQSITSAVYLAKEEIKSLPESNEKEDLKESLETIEEQVTYIDKVVSDLQDFVKPLNPKIEESDPHKIIKDSLSNIAIPENIKVLISIAEDLPQLMVDKFFIKRVLINLITNAIQAMPNGGELTIKAHHENGIALISVEDTGVGIPKENRNKIFKPLFTTKSKGQGFGLPVCKRLMEAHNGGSITVESEVGKGSKFNVKVPIKVRRTKGGNN